jgi:hypothetical protein
VKTLHTSASIASRNVRSFALGAVLLAASAGSALANPAPDAPASSQNDDSSISAVTVRPRVTPRPIDGDGTAVVAPKPVAVAPRAQAASPVVAAEDPVFIAQVKSAYGWEVFPTDIAVVKTNAEFAAQMQSGYGWIDLPAGLVGAKDDAEFAASVSSILGQP